MKHFPKQAVAAVATAAAYPVSRPAPEEVARILLAATCKVESRFDPHMCVSGNVRDGVSVSCDVAYQNPLDGTVSVTTYRGWSTIVDIAQSIGGRRVMKNGVVRRAGQDLQSRMDQAVESARRGVPLPSSDEFDRMVEEAEAKRKAEQEEAARQHRLEELQEGRRNIVDTISYCGFSLEETVELWKQAQIESVMEA